MPAGDPRLVLDRGLAELLDTALKEAEALTEEDEDPDREENEEEDSDSDRSPASDFESSSLPVALSAACKARYRACRAPRK